MTHLVDERWTEHGDGRLVVPSRIRGEAAPDESNRLHYMFGRGEGERIWKRRGQRAGRGRDLSHRMHAAWDIPGPERTPVRAAMAGDVIWAGMIGGYGHAVILLHLEDDFPAAFRTRDLPGMDDLLGPAPRMPKKTTTAYAHLDSESVTIGDRVVAGEEIGLLGGTYWDRFGETGGVGGGIPPHLHFSVQLLERERSRRYRDRWRHPRTGWRVEGTERRNVPSLGEFVGDSEQERHFEIRTGSQMVRVSDGSRERVLRCQSFSSHYEEDWRRQVEPVAWMRALYGADWREYATTLGKRQDNEDASEQERQALARNDRKDAREP